MRAGLIFAHIIFGLLYQLEYFFFPSHVFQVAAPGLRFFDGSPYVQVLAGMSALTGLAAVLFPRNRFLVLTTALLALPFIFDSTVGRLAFSYLPTYSLLFLGLSELAGSLLIYRIGVAGLYFTIAFHKLAHPIRTGEWIEFAVRVMAEPGVLKPILDAFPPTLAALKYAGAPIEILIAVLLLVPRTFGWGLALAFLFHTVLTFVIGARQYDLVVLVTVLQLTMLAVQGSHASVRSVAQRKSSAIVFGAVIAILFFKTILLIAFEFESALLDSAIITAMLTGPFAALAVAGLGEKSSPDPAPSKGTSARAKHRGERYAVAAAVGVVFAWAMYPVASGYVNRNLGFAMFTANDEERLFSEFSVVGPSVQECVRAQSIIRPVIFPETSAGRLIFYSTDLFALRNWRAYLVHNCPDLDFQEIKPAGTIRAKILGD